MNNDLTNLKEKLLEMQNELLNEIKKYSLSELYYFNLKNILEIYSLENTQKTLFSSQSVYTILLKEQKRWNKQNYIDILITVQIQDFLILLKLYSSEDVSDWKNDKFIKHLPNIKNYKFLLKNIHNFNSEILASLITANNNDGLNFINILTKYSFKFQMLKQSIDISWFYAYNILFENDFFKSKFCKNFNTVFSTNIYFSIGFSNIISLISKYNKTIDKNYYNQNYWLNFIDNFMNKLFLILGINNEIIERYIFNYNDMINFKKKINIENQDFLIFNNLFNFYKKPFIKIKNKISLLSFSDYNYILTEGSLSYLYLLEEKSEWQLFHKHFEDHIFNMVKDSSLVKNNKLNITREKRISCKKNENLVSSDITLWNNEIVLFIEIKWTTDKIWKNTKENFINEINEFINRHIEKGGVVEQLNRIEKIYKFSKYKDEKINLNEKLGLPLYNEKIKIYKIAVFREMSVTNEFNNEFRLDNKIICFNYVDFSIILKNFNNSINDFIEILENKILKKEYNQFHNTSLWQEFILDKSFLTIFLQKYNFSF